MPEGEFESVSRFSARAGEYTRHRPDYPVEALDCLVDHDFLEVGTRVADIGAGTGIFTEQLIGKGAEVWAVEPNAAMRSIAETALSDRHQFHSVAGDAGDMPLEDQSVELVTAAQAFHWFDREAARSEFARVLESPERVAFAWNIRDREGSEFMTHLEDVIAEHGVDYEDVYQTYYRRIDELDDFFSSDETDGDYRHRQFDHTQPLDLHGLLGLVTSFSYMPRPGSDDFDQVTEALRDVFEAHEQGGEVEVLYDTELYFGQLG